MIACRPSLVRTLLGDISRSSDSARCFQKSSAWLAMVVLGAPVIFLLHEGHLHASSTFVYFPFESWPWVNDFHEIRFIIFLSMNFNLFLLNVEKLLK